MTTDLLVTGASGFLGAHLLEFLHRQAGNRVWGVSRSGGQVGVTSIHAVDLTNREALMSWRKGKPRFAVIFHLAAAVPTTATAATFENSFLPNVQMAENIRWLAAADASWIVYASGTSVYGPLTTAPVTEDLCPQPRNWYTLAKYVGELVLSHAVPDRAGGGTTSLRISAPYGPHQKAATVVNVFLKAARDGKPLQFYGTGNRSQDFTYVDDVVAAMWRAYQQRAPGPYNICSESPVSMRALAATVLSVVPGSSSVIACAGVPDPDEEYRAAFSAARARRTFGYGPATCLSEGLRRCVAALGH